MDLPTHSPIHPYSCRRGNGKKSQGREFPRILDMVHHSGYELSYGPMLDPRSLYWGGFPTGHEHMSERQRGDRSFCFTSLTGTHTSFVYMWLKPITNTLILEFHYIWLKCKWRPVQLGPL